MFDINFYVELCKTFGFGVAQTGLVVFLLVKIATNHLKHIADDIKLIQTSVDNVAKDVEDIKKGCGPCKERLAKLEGKLE